MHSKPCSSPSTEHHPRRVTASLLSHVFCNIKSCSLCGLWILKQHSQMQQSPLRIQCLHILIRRYKQPDVQISISLSSPLYEDFMWSENALQAKISAPSRSIFDLRRSFSSANIPCSLYTSFCTHNSSSAQDTYLHRRSSHLCLLLRSDGNDSAQQMAQTASLIEQHALSHNTS